MFKFKYLFLLICSLFFIFGCDSSNNSSQSSTGDNSAGSSYTISFESNGGTGLMDNISVSSGDTVILPNNTFVYAGFDFAGWALSKDGDAVYSDGQAVTVNNNITLYAVWSLSDNPVIYTVIFDGNGGSGSMDNQLFNAGENKALSSNLYYYDGYTFAGWSTSDKGNPIYSDGEVITATSDMLLYAVWSKDSSGGIIPSSQITIYFNPNDGDGYMLPLTVDANTDVQLTQNIYTRAGFAFKGWSTTKNGAVEYSDMQSVSFSKDTELFAVWESVPFYKVTLHSNNGSDETKVIEFVSNVMPVKLPYNTFQNGSKKFTGWKTSDNLISYIDGCDVVYLNGDIDLYASWSDNPVTISFDPLGGKGEMPDIYAMPGDTIKLPAAEFTRNGYELKDTYTYYIYTYKFGDDFTVPDTDVVFYANWRELPKPPLPVFGGNSAIYKNTYVLVNGVKMTEKDWIQSLTPGIFYGVWNKNAGWYDSSQWRYNLCWAGTSSNMLHWWYDRNKENIEKYYNYYASDEIVKNKPSSKYYGKGESDIFITFRDHWKDAGYLIEIGLEWYIFGTHYNKNGGGYFKEVFLEEDVPSVVESYAGVTQYLLNTNLNKAFEKGMAVGLAEVNGFGSHAITLWGAHYDENGLVDGVIVADSGTRSGNNAPSGYDTGLVYMNIEYDNMGKPFMTNSYGSRLPLTKLVLLADGAEQWQKYFDTHEKIR